MAYHVYDYAAAHRLLHRPGGGVARDMWARGQRVKAAQQRLVGRTSGALARDLHVQWLHGQAYPGVEVGSDLPQAMHHTRGHGVIVPVKAKALRFKPKGGTRFIFARRVRAVKGNPFLRRSLRAARRGGF